MRVANKTLYDNIIQNLGKVSSEMVAANNVVSTGKKLNKLSDDPVGLVTVLDLRSSLAEITQIARNITMGRSWLTAAESSLTQTQSIITDVKALCVQYSSANVSANDRQNAVDMVDGMLKEIISLANSQSGGKYVFSGTNSDSAPFALDPIMGQVVYSGTDTSFSIKIGQGTNIEIGRDGQKVFGENWDSDNIFRSLVDLKTYLQTNDIANIQNTMGLLDSHMDKLSSTIADIGGKTIRLNIKDSIIQDLKLTYTDRKSQIEDADYAEAVLDLNAKELAYEAALASASKAMTLSLVDYI
jgi:flagellar hook-associated protein 3 FlgL